MCFFFNYSQKNNNANHEEKSGYLHCPMESELIFGDSLKILR